MSRSHWRPQSADQTQRRSPSPPPFGAVDWLEALEVAAAISAYDGRRTAHKRRRQDGGSTSHKYMTFASSSGPNGAMDALSSVALEYAPPAVMAHGERPNKRAKSEKYTLNDGREHGRPTTSYTRPTPTLTQPTTTMQDAELLLNFFTTARTTPAKSSPTASHTRSVSFGQPPAFIDRGFYPQSNEPLPQYQSSYVHPTHGPHEHTLTSSSTTHDTPFSRKDGARGTKERALDVESTGNGSSNVTSADDGPGPLIDEHTNGKDTDTAAAPPFNDTQGLVRSDMGPPQSIRSPLGDGAHTTIGNGDSVSVAPQYAHVTPQQSQANGSRLPYESQSALDVPVKQEASVDNSRIPAQNQSIDGTLSQDQQQAEERRLREVKEQICSACGFHRNSLTLETENEATSWISCDGCNKWFHFACAGFKSEREVRSVDKYRCRTCKPIHGPTTYVRKSSRAHAPIDYAELNQGVVKTSDESPEHHYIKPIKEGSIKFDPETFARIRPELITADFWLRGEGMQEPVVIPAKWNPQPRRVPRPEDARDDTTEDTADDGVLHDQTALESDVADQFEYEQEVDEGQDALGMVIPRDLTVRRVAELYGPEEKLEVIDVKSQNGEDKRWNMRKWADYYESDAPNKPVRNVISLEVSQSALGRLIRRPKVVRDLDLQDSVWPEELMARGDYPKVQFYCLMSVADCYTDFHIDFGGSSVYYHIIKGKKTFFFIPPTETNLKKYEDWCNSDAQNYTFLGDQTKTCYRVDLGPGDTMLIPAGWIHAVWTPEDSLVIGGNFLTRQNFPMQIRITQIEKATGVARKFRYPSFQKIQWYTVIKYLSEDPIPQSVVDLLLSGKKFERDIATGDDYDAWGENSYSGPGTESYHSRFYPRCELEGLPELARYIQRTAYIAAGYVTDGVNSDTKRAVQRSIPKEYKHHGSEPVDCVRKFAMWYCWKRGNELLPHWAYPDYVPETNAPEVTQKKLSAAHVRRLEREAAMSAERVSDRPQRERKQPTNLYNEMMSEQENARTTKASSPLDGSPVKQDTPVATAPLASVSPAARKDVQPRKRKSSSGTINRQPACEACRKGRRACKHRDPPVHEGANSSSSNSRALSQQASNGDTMDGIEFHGAVAGTAVSRVPSQAPDVNVVIPGQDLSMVDPQLLGDSSPASVHIGLVAAKDGSTPGRSKACADCRKSKRRCIHDEYGRQDPVKMAQAAQPRPAAKKKRPSEGASEASGSKRSRKSQGPKQEQGSHDDFQPTAPVAPVAPMASMMAGVSTAFQQPTPVLPSETLSQVGDDASLMPVMSDAEAKSSGLDFAAPLPQDTSSALVSPPESAHTDHERADSPTHTPKPTVEVPEDGEKSRDLTPPTTASAPRSRRSSQLVSKQAATQSPVRARSRAMSTTSSDSRILDDMLKRRTSSNAVNEVDQETLQVIKDLAAQDRGLRRRESRPG